jgi:acetyl-CoA acetyltransferase
VLGPLPACKNPFARAGQIAQRIAFAGLNEAFAAQAIRYIEPLGVDPGRANVRGGAIASGHSLGTSGARLVLTMMIELEQSQRRLGLGTSFQIERTT